MLWVALILAVAGAAASGYSAYQGSKESNKTARFNQEQAARAAELAETQASQVQQRGAVEERQHRLQVAKLIGKQRAGFGASGVRVDTGSAYDVVSGSRIFGEMDAQTIAYNAAIESWAKREEASQFRSQYSFYKRQRTSPGLATTMAVLGGATPLASSFLGSQASKAKSP